MVDGCGDVGSPAQPDIVSSRTAVTARVVIRALIACRVFETAPAPVPVQADAGAASPLAFSGFILRQVVPDDAHLTMGQAGRIAMQFAVELPRRAVIVAVRVNFVAVGEP